jgi:hypothetical protein
MELRTFTKKTILDLIGGVTDAQQEAPDDCVVPSVSNTFKSVETGISDLQGVEFEVVVRAEQTKGSEAKLTVLTSIIGGGVKGQSGEEAGHTATLRFKVPIRFPRK